MKRIGWIAAAWLLALPLLAHASDGFVTANANLRAGPDIDYPRIATIPIGARVSILGCTEDWAWCDVIAFGNRGWMIGDYLQYDDGRRRVLVPAYGARVGIPIVTFVIGDYWGNHYRHRPFYQQRHYWYRHPVHRHPRRRGHRPFERHGPPPPYHRPPRHGPTMHRQSSAHPDRASAPYRSWGPANAPRPREYRPATRALPAAPMHPSARPPQPAEARPSHDRGGSEHGSRRRSDHGDRRRDSDPA